jgi:hypothetical protein
MDGNMIAELAQDLINKIKTVTVLGDRIGMAAAGGATDPSMASVPLPAAWLLFESDSIEVTYQGPVQDITYNFSLALHVSYSSQSDLINNQLPTIETIARSVSGKDSTSSASKWHYQGAQLVDVYNDRLVYELSFMVQASYTN